MAIRLFLLVLLLPLVAACPAQQIGDDVTEELDAFWAEVSRTVAEGDFDGYSATYHADAVLVSVGSGNSYPIADALAGWKQGFVDTAAGAMSAKVDFRFTRRLHDETTAHETGMFRYVAQEPGKDPSVTWLHFEALLVKKGGWLMLMEFQQEPATEEEWAAAGS